MDVVLHHVNVNDGSRIQMKLNVKRKGMKIEHIIVILMKLLRLKWNDDDTNDQGRRSLVVDTVNSDGHVNDNQRHFHPMMDYRLILMDQSKDQFHNIFPYVSECKVIEDDEDDDEEEEEDDQLISIPFNDVGTLIKDEVYHHPVNRSRNRTGSSSIPVKRTISHNNIKNKFGDELFDVATTLTSTTTAAATTETTTKGATTKVVSQSPPSNTSIGTSSSSSTSSFNTTFSYPNKSEFNSFDSASSPLALFNIHESIHGQAYESSPYPMHDMEYNNNTDLPSTLDVQSKYFTEQDKPYSIDAEGINNNNNNNNSYGNSSKNNDRLVSEHDEVIRENGEVNKELMKYIGITGVYCRGKLLSLQSQPYFLDAHSSLYFTFQQMDHDIDFNGYLKPTQSPNSLGFQIVGAYHAVKKARKESKKKCIEFLNKTNLGLKHGLEMKYAGSGLTGASLASYMNPLSKQIETVSCFKPCSDGTNHSQDLRSFRDGVLNDETSAREVAAYMLDHGSFSDVPATLLVESPQRKVGSLQEFIHTHGTADDFGMQLFSNHEVHKIAILDIRLCNLDRNSDNILVKKIQNASNLGGYSYKLIPIDHGYCLPDRLENGWYNWCWIDWPHTKAKFDEETLKYIASLDPEKDAELLRNELGIREECIKVMLVSTTVLKMCAEAGLNLFDIITLVGRYKDGDKPSVIEEIMRRAEELTHLMMTNSRTRSEMHITHDVNDTNPSSSKMNKSNDNIDDDAKNTKGHRALARRRSSRGLIRTSSFDSKFPNIDAPLGSPAHSHNFVASYGSTLSSSSEYDSLLSTSPRHSKILDDNESLVQYSTQDSNGYSSIGSPKSISHGLTNHQHELINSSILLSRSSSESHSIYAFSQSSKEYYEIFCQYLQSIVKDAIVEKMKLKSMNAESENLQSLSAYSPGNESLSRVKIPSPNLGVLNGKIMHILSSTSENMVENLHFVKQKYDNSSEIDQKYDDAIIPLDLSKGQSPSTRGITSQGLSPSHFSLSSKHSTFEKKAESKRYQTILTTIQAPDIDIGGRSITSISHIDINFSVDDFGFQQ